MQIKKTELAKIIREEIANVIEEARRYGRRRRPPSYMAMANIHRDNIERKEKQMKRYQATLDDESASEEDKEEARKWIDALTRRIADDQALLDAEEAKLKRFGRIQEDEIQAARYEPDHLPDNTEPGRVGKVQPLEEVGILSTMLDPAMVAGLSDAARVAIAMLDPILTMGLPSAAVAGLMSVLMKNEDIPKEEREMIADALEGDKPAGIPADELGAKR